jgi:hypothetical protein
MGKTAVPLSNEPAAGAPARSAPAPRTRTAWSVVRDVLAPVASLRVTVVLFVLAMVLVFVGTLAQIDEGIWTVVNKYFRCWTVVWVPLQLFFPRTWHVPGGFPFPGGWLIGGALLVNLLAAHLVRFKLSWKRSGVLILHAGLVILMVSELLTGLYAAEGDMTILVGKSSKYVEDHEKPELAILTPADDKTDDVVVVPKRLLRKGGLIHDEQLPFDVEVVRYMVNCGNPRPVARDTDNPATAGLGLEWTVQERPEGNGVSHEQKADYPAAYVTFKKKGTDESLGTYLLTPWFYAMDVPPQKLTLDGKTYEVALRWQRRYKPYTIQLLKFTHSVYPGTAIPKDFRSTVRLVDRDLHEDRQVDIYMNHPLRYRGETFYQISFVPPPEDDPNGKDRGTILQVVRNPSSTLFWWPLPYWACGMVALGMVVHFVIHLNGFLRRRVAS